MRTISVTTSHRSLSSHVGLLLVLALVRGLGLVKKVNDALSVKQRRRGFNEANFLLSLILNITRAKTDFEDLKTLAVEPVVCAALGSNFVPSPNATRQHLEKFRWEDLPKVRGLNNVVLERLELKENEFGFVPLDVDVACMEQYAKKREEVGRTYQGYDGFAPFFAHLGTEGGLLNSWLRNGKDHSANRADEFLAETLALVPERVEKKVLVRMDAGFDSAQVINVLEKHPRVHWIVKANFRSHLDHVVEDIPAGSWRILAEHSWGREDYAAVPYKSKSMHKPCRFLVVRETKLVDEDGQRLLFSEVSEYGVFTDLRHRAETVLELYRQRGTSEQFHTEFKTHLDMEQLPSRDFLINSIFLTLGMIAYNLLKSLAETWLKTEREGAAEGTQTPDRRRLLTVIQDVIRVAGYVTKSGRDYTVDLGSVYPVADIFTRVLARIPKGT